MDYQFDQTTDGRILKLLNIVDEHTREALIITVDRRIDADATVAVLDRLVDVQARCETLGTAGSFRCGSVRAIVDDPHTVTCGTEPAAPC